MNVFEDVVVQDLPDKVLKFKLFVYRTDSFKFFQEDVSVEIFHTDILHCSDEAESAITFTANVEESVLETTVMPKLRRMITASQRAVAHILYYHKVNKYYIYA